MWSDENKSTQLTTRAIDASGLNAIPVGKQNEAAVPVPSAAPQVPAPFPATVLTIWDIDGIKSPSAVTKTLTCILIMSHAIVQRRLD